MDVKVEKVLGDGAYDAKVFNVEQKETKFGDRIMWTFDLPGENIQVVGFTSMSPSTKAKTLGVSLDYQLSKSAKANRGRLSCSLSQMQKLCNATLAAKRARNPAMS